MKFLKQVEVKNGKFEATFFNGKKTTNRSVASFYMMMQDKDADEDEAKSYIKLGRHIDFDKPWDEIEEIIK